MIEALKQLKRHLEEFASIPLTEWAHAIPQFKILSMKKGEHFFRQGEPTETLGFIIRGLGHVYFSDSKGRQATRRFMQPGVPICSFPALLSGEVASDSLEALEDMLIVSTPYPSFVKLMDRHVCWERIMRRGLERELIERENREYELFMLSATERYENFCRMHPSLLDRVPQYMIASYLGVTPVALSRIRGRRTKPKS